MTRKRMHQLALLHVPDLETRVPRPGNSDGTTVDCLHAANRRGVSGKRVQALPAIWSGKIVLYLRSRHQLTLL